MLAAHNTDTGDKGLLPGKVADCIGVLLKHWRKVTKNPKNWEALCGRLEGVKAAQLNKTYKKMSQTFEGGQKTTTRTLKVELSEVSVDSLGLAKVASASESDDRQIQSFWPLSGSCLCLYLSCLCCSQWNLCVCCVSLVLLLFGAFQSELLRLAA